MESINTNSEAIDNMLRYLVHADACFLFAETNTQKKCWCGLTQARILGVQAIGNTRINERTKCANIARAAADKMLQLDGIGGRTDVACNILEEIISLN